MEKQEEQKQEPLMKCMACGEMTPISKGKLTFNKNQILCLECDELLGKGAGYK